MIINHKCFECDYEGEVKSDNRKIICPNCGTINDFWLKGEIPPIHHRKTLKFQH